MYYVFQSPSIWPLWQADKMIIWPSWFLVASEPNDDGDGLCQQHRSEKFRPGVCNGGSGCAMRNTDRHPMGNGKTGRGRGIKGEQKPEGHE
jgi:hypothetical protein